VGKLGFQVRFLNPTPFIKPHLSLLKVSCHVSEATFYRLFIADILPADIHEAVYMDADMLAVRSAESLFSVPITNLIGAVDHFNPYDAVRLWGADACSYFQAGVLMIPVEEWRKRNLSSTFLSILRHQEAKIKWWDQDVLNIALAESWQRIDLWLNVHGVLPKLFSHEDIMKNTKIYHFCGSEKPWNSYEFTSFVLAWDSVFKDVYGKEFNRQGLRPPFHQKLKERVRRVLQSLNP
jgi:lipopolysaccharide biosynthesis glycosyltransferase